MATVWTTDWNTWWDASGGGGGGPPTLVSIAVTPSNSTSTPLSAADTTQFTATGTYDSGPDQDITGSVTWSVTSGTSVTIDAAGLATPQSTGTATVQAELGAVTGDTDITVDTARDATSGIRVPANAYQFALGGYTVSHLFLCQEASGNLADSVGALTLTANATPLYSQVHAGWDRDYVGFSQVANQRFSAAAAVGPNPATTDVFWCAYMVADTLPSGLRGTLAAGANCYIVMTAGGGLRLSIAGVTVDDTTTRTDLDDIAHPIGLLQDATNSRTAMFTDEAKTIGTHAAATDGTKGIGGNAVSTTSLAANGGAFYIFVMTGAAARLSDADVKSLYQWLGWTVPWT